MRQITTGDRLKITGGSTLLREGIANAFSNSASGETILKLIVQLETSVTILVTDTEAQWISLGELAQTEPNVVAVVPTLDIGEFVRALRLGASGAVWEDTPTSHLAAVTRAALRNDALIPRPVLDAMLRGSVDAVPNALDAADLGILKEVASGRSLPEIAEIIFVNKRTLQRRVTAICLRLGATTPSQAVHIATRQGLI